MLRLVVILMLLAPLIASMSKPALAAQTSSVVFTFAEGVSAEDEALIQEGIRFSQEYAAEHLGRAVERAFRVDVRPSQEVNVPGYVGNSVLYLATDHPVWRESPPMRRLKIVAHEYFHLIQLQSIRDSRPVPTWLMEGSAELFAFEAVSSLGLVDYGAVVDHWIAGMFNDPAIAGVPLEEMEQPVPEVACCLYTVSPLAVRELLGNGGWSSFLAYIDVFSTMPPDEAFSESFGQNLPGFYTYFALARQQMFMNADFALSLRLPWYPVEWGADVWSVTARTPVARGGQALVTAWSVTGVRCTLDFISASGNHLLTQSTYANQDGLVFWLFSVRERLAEGAAHADVTCGTNTISATIDLT